VWTGVSWTGVDRSFGTKPGDGRKVYRMIFGLEDDEGGFVDRRGSVSERKCFLVEAEVKLAVLERWCS
jgi:hypothetical protein